MKKSSSISILIFAAILSIASCTHKVTPTVAAATSVSPVKEEMVASVIEGEKTYKASCGRCHKLENPKSYTTIEWERIMKSMAVKAKLTDQQKADVSAYLAINAKQ